MEHTTLSDIVLGSIVPVAVIFLLVWGVKRALDWWADKRRRHIDAELVDLPAKATTSSAKCCDVCGTTNKGIGWRRGPAIAARGGILGYWRKLLGVPLSYVRDVADWESPDLCAECSHALDVMYDERITKTHLATRSIDSAMAIEHQQFVAGARDALRERVTLAGRARRIGAGNGVRALSS